MLQGLRHLLGGLRLVNDDALVALLVVDEAAVEILGDLADLGVGLGQDLGLLRRDQGVAHRNGEGADGGVFEALGLHAVEHHRGHLGAVDGDAAVDDLAQRLFGDQEADLEVEHMLGVAAVHIAQVLRDGLVEDDAADGGVHHLAQRLAVHLAGAAHLDGRLQGDDVRGVGHQGLVLVAEDLALALVALVDHGQVVAAQNHILGGHGDRLAVGGFEQVAGGQHQHLGLALGLAAQRQVHGHLVAVEVGVEGGTHQRMQLDGAAFHQHRLKGLDAQTVQGGRAVQHHGMPLDDGLQAVPHLGAGALHHLAGGFDVVGNAVLHQVLHHEGLEQLQRHLLGQAALVHLQLGAHDDNRTAGVVHALAQQVLAEAALLALQHVGQALQRAVVGAGDRTAAAAVVDQGVHRLLQHALLVAHDDVGSAQLQQALQTVVAVDDAAVQVVQVAGGEAAAVQLDHRADIGRDDGHHVQDHPLGAVAGQTERLHNLQALQQADALLAAGVLQLGVQLGAQLIQVDLGQQLLDGLGAHRGLELVLIAVAHLAVFLLAQQLLFLQRSEAGIGDDVAGEIQDLLQQAGAEVQHQADAAGDALEVPDVGHGGGQLDVAHALAAHLGAGHFHAAAVADLALVADALILAAVALPVLGRSKDALTEQAVALGLQGAVVDGLGLLHLAIAPFADLVGGSKANFNRIESVVFH